MNENLQTLRVLQSMDKEDDSIRVLQCEGYLNFDTYDQVKNILARLFRNGIYKIVFDLQEIKYISSSGWSVFLGPLETTRSSGGDLKLASMPEQVKFVFDALELGNIFKLYDTVEDAVAAFKNAGK
jgi:anti-sigma B factor antagonist